MSDKAYLVIGAVIIFGGIVGVGMSLSNWIPTISLYVTIGSIIALIVGLVFAVPSGIKIARGESD